MAEPRRIVGRPRAPEITEEKIQVGFKPSEWAQFQAVRGDRPMATFIKDAIRDLYEGRLISVEDLGRYERRPRFLATAPCGPWQEAVAGAEPFVLSKDVAEALEYQNGDAIVQASGQSMDGAGIFDGALLLMRPVQQGRSPRKNEITLVQIFRDGVCESTIKHWQPGNPPTLTDGDGEPYPIPEGNLALVASYSPGNNFNIKARGAICAAKEGVPFTRGSLFFGKSPRAILDNNTACPSSPRLRFRCLWAGFLFLLHKHPRHAGCASATILHKIPA